MMKTSLTKTLILSALLGIGAVSFGVSAKSAISVAAKQPIEPSKGPGSKKYAKLKSHEELFNSSSFIFAFDSQSYIATGIADALMTTTKSSFVTNASGVSETTVQNAFAFSIKFINKAEYKFNLTYGGQYLSLDASGVSLTSDSSTTGARLTLTFSATASEIRSEAGYGLYFGRDKDKFTAVELSAKRGADKPVSLFGAPGNLDTSLLINEFNGALTCDSTGANGPTFADGKSWESIEAQFEDLSINQKNRLAVATYSVVSTGTTNVINPEGDLTQEEADFLYMYDYIVAKYGWKNFLGRPGVVASINRALPVNKSNKVAVTVVSGLIGLTSIAAFFYVKARKLENN